MVDWFTGPITPYRELKSIRPDFAPAYYKSRIDTGSFGSFDIQEAARAANLSDLKYVREQDLAEEVDKFHPAVMYQSFDAAFVKKELWHAYATLEVLERQAHTCVRVEVVAAVPTDENRTKLNRRGGVTVLVRCTLW